MCGIAGIWHLNSEKLELGKLKKFTDAIAHRGPDGSGYEIFEDVSLGLGHRRLSILDLTVAGKQPMQYQDSNLHISYNGEVYNFIELREELKQLGYKFITDTDTEVILAAYLKWGFDAFNKFNGMWAMALYNANTKKLLLCRDRFGVKPLYYSFSPGSYFCFASETYAFKHLENFNLEFESNTLLTAMHNPVMIEGSGNTIFKSVYQLLPGHFVNIDVQIKEINQHRWFQIPQQYNSIIKFSDAVEQFKHLFENALKLRLRSDVPVGTALSGGMDSSSVYCFLKYLSNNNVKLERAEGNYLKAFVATFKDTLQDERKYAEEVIKYTNGDVKYIETNFDSIISNIESSSILFNDITATPISVLSDVYKGMRESGVTVSMDGHGVDEMLYGYKSLVSMASNHALYNGDINYLNDLKNTYLQLFNASDQLDEEVRFENKVQKLNALYGMNTSLGKLKHLLKSKVKENIVSKKQFFEYESLNTDAWFNNKALSSLQSASKHKINLNFYNSAEKELAIDFYYRNIPYNMRDFDRAAMQHGIEIRMPFMDYNLVNFCFSLPMKYKVGNGYTKLVLREAMKGIVPESIRTRKSKIGIGAPINDWFNNQLNSYLVDTVTSSRFMNSSYWNGSLLKDFVLNKCKNKSWQYTEAQKFWFILNAHIISK